MVCVRMKHVPKRMLTGIGATLKSVLMELESKENGDIVMKIAKVSNKILAFNLI